MSRQLGVPEADLLWCWAFVARPEQLPPAGTWRLWWIKAGRGFGKTRAGAEASRAAARTYRWTTYVGPTADAIRAVMVEGESGILRICPKGERPRYRPSLRRLDWPNGGRTYLYSADEPDRLRGPQHQWAWAEEPAAWRYPEAWDQLMFGLRLPPDPRCVVTGTPKPVRIIRELAEHPACVITSGASYANRANLDPTWFADLMDRYQGTRLGRQELEAELLMDVPGAHWRPSIIPHGPPPERDSLARVAVGVDPSASDTEDSAEMGIVVAGRGWDGQGYVLADRTVRGSAAERGWAVMHAAWEFDADVVVLEVNNGGDWIEALLRALLAEGGDLPPLPAIKVVRASRGKLARAEPIAAQYEQGRWVHAPVDEPTMGWRGMVQPLAVLEDQLCTYVPDASIPSPDRMDALVWAATDLRVSGRPHVPPGPAAGRKGKAAHTAGMGGVR